MLASPFLFSAITKMLDFETAVSEVRALSGFEPAPVFAALVITTQLGGGLALLTSGRFAPMGGLLVAVFTLVATLLGHPFWSRSGTAFTRDATTFLEHLGLIAGLILMAWLIHQRRREV